jgi:uncharacterized protein YdeI (YjbR/CyaY-like superfamily)
MPKLSLPKPEIFHPRERRDWRQWLAGNHAKSPGVSLVIARKKSGKPGISYAEAVEEALSFGWIDSRTNKLDEFSYLLHFSPRQAGGTWAKSNQERVEKLIKQGLMTAAGLKVVKASRKDGSWNRLQDVENLVIPPDLARHLTQNYVADKYFQSWSDSVKKQVLWYLKSAKRPETREKRIAQIIASAERNRQPWQND